ncbi:hypothetical protein ABG067_009320, partial [Albugo candida]
MTNLHPDPRGLCKHLAALVDQEGGVAGRGVVQADREGDVGIDVILRGSTGIMRRGLVAGDRTPRKQRAAVMAQRARIVARRVE